MPNIFYLDYANGSDGYPTPKGWWVSQYSGATGPAPAVDASALGGTSGATARITDVSTTQWNAGSGQIYYYGKNGTFVSENVTTTGGGSYNISGDPSYCAWQTFTYGATAARCASGDIVKIHKSPDPVYLCDASWTCGPMPIPVTITSSTNTSPIAIVKNTGHGLVTNDVVQILGHTVNTNANGTWYVDVSSALIFLLRDSSGNGTGGASGNFQKITSKAVILNSSTFVAEIDNCDVSWNAVNGAGVILQSYATDNKEGTGCMQITFPAAGTVENTLYAFRTIPTKNLSNYSRLTFWLKFSNNFWYPLDQHKLKICLCSDTSGLVPVNSFIVNPLLQAWAPYVISPSEGGNLGSSIRSVAFYSDSSAYALNGNYIRIDNILACGSTGLNLTSLITKNGSTNGGDELFYCIQSIKNNIVLLDNGRSTPSNRGRGYYGTTECVSTYIRESSYRKDFNTVVNGAFDVANISGITYDGGYNRNSNIRDGETILDQTHIYAPIGIYLSSADGNIIKNLSICRGTNGIYYGNRNIIENVKCFSNNNYGLVWWSNNYNIVRNYSGYNNSQSGFHFSGASQTFNDISINKLLNNETIGGFGCDINTSGIIHSKNNIYIDLIANNSQYGMQMQLGYKNNITIKNCIVSPPPGGSTSFGLYFGYCQENYVSHSSIDCCTGTSCLYTYPNVTSPTYLYDTELIGTEFYSSTNQVFSQNHDKQENNNLIVSNNQFFGYIINDSSIRHTNSDFSWRMVLSSYQTTPIQPLEFSLAKVAVEANKTSTIKTWMKLSADSSVGAQLICKGNESIGLPYDVSVQAAYNTNWQQLSIQITPSSTGVVEIQAIAYSRTGQTTSIGDVWIDDMSFN